MSTTINPDGEQPSASDAVGKLTVRTVGPPPFVRYDPPFGVYEFLKTVIVAVTLMPLRILLIVVVASVHLVMLRIALLGAKPNQPFGPIRRMFLAFNPMVARLGLLALGFHWISVYGKKNRARAPNKPPTVVCNHLGFLDAAFLECISHPVVPVAKAELLKVPFISLLMRGRQTLFVARGEDKAANNRILMERITSFQNSHDGKGPQMMLFPEGTTSNGRYLLLFRKGAFVAGKPVQPYALRFKWKHINPSWETYPAVSLFFRLLLQFHNRVEIHILPVYTPTAAERDDPILYANNVRQEVADVLGLPYHPATLADKLLYHDLVLKKKLTIDDYLAKLDDKDRELLSPRLA